MDTVLFPYNTLSTDPVVQLSSPTVDGKPAAIIKRDLNIDLFEVEYAWRAARVGLRVLVPTEEVSAIGATDVSVVATVNCSATNLRIARRLDAAAQPGQWVGDIDLPRTLLADRADLYVTVAGSVDGVPNRWLSRSDVIRVNVARPRTPDIGTTGDMTVVWRDFTQADEGQSPIDPLFHGEIAFVDIAASKGPVIYLNDAVPGLRRLLDDRSGRSAVEKASRELVFDLIAQTGWIGMFNAAVSAAAKLADDGGPQFPSADWQRGALESLLPLMYPDREPLAALGDVTDSESDPNDVQSRLLAASGRLMRTKPHVDRLMKALENHVGQEA